MSVLTDYYEILGVATDASPQEMKRAFKKRVKKLHPDVATGESEGFRQLKDAYDVLSSPEKRRLYDQKDISIGMIDEYFAHQPMGRRIVETMTDKAPSAPRPGVDTVLVKEISPKMARKGAVISVKIGSEKMDMQVPPGVFHGSWCKIHGLGEKGRNAESGNLWIMFVVKNKA